MQVRDAGRGDARAIAAIGRIAFAQQYEGLVDPANYTWAARRWYSDEAIQRAVDEAAGNPTTHFLVAEREGSTLGFLEYDERGPEPELRRIYVASQARGRGAGTALMRALHARLAPAAQYVLVVVDGNRAAIRFYLRHGLQEERLVSGHEYYRQTAGVMFPAEAEDFRCVLMRYRASAAHRRSKEQ